MEAKLTLEQLEAHPGTMEASEIMKVHPRTIERGSLLSHGVLLWNDEGSRCNHGGLQEGHVYTHSGPMEAHP
jgi:hypothetical protein